MKEVRYLQSTDELEITDELGFPRYISLDDLKLVDANERELGTETELAGEDGLHVFFYPEGHLSDYYWENENERIMRNSQMLDISKLQASFKDKVSDILDQRMTELKEIKEQNRYHGLTMRDECLIDGGITEIEILKERIQKL